MNEKYLEEFRKTFGKDFGWSSQDGDGQIQVERFLGKTLNDVRLEELNRIKRIADEYVDKYDDGMWAGREIMDDFIKLLKK